MDVQVYLLNLLSDPNWHPGLHRIPDSGQVARFELSVEEAQEAMERVAQLPEVSRREGLAAVAPKNPMFGTDRVFRTMLAAASPTLQVFSGPDGGPAAAGWERAARLLRVRGHGPLGLSEEGGVAPLGNRGAVLHRLGGMEYLRQNLGQYPESLLSPFPAVTRSTRTALAI